MPSDAFMELSDPLVWGETTDDQYGPTGRNLGAFEIFSFDFSATANREDDDGSGSKRNDRSDPKRGGVPVSGQAGAAVSQPVVKQFTITKYIDKASADLFLNCCKSTCKDYKPIDWAIISIREMGEVKHKPYLILEFTNLTVDAFSWKLSPGAAADSAAQEETVTFSFETILVKYSRQERSGEHTKVKIKGFNRKHPDQEVPELESEALQAEQF